MFGDTDAVKSVSVMEGESVTLNTGVTEIKNNSFIQWMFGNETIVISEINKWADRIAVYDDVLDGRFRDRLKLNIRSASLTIINITIEHAGSYSLWINGARKKKINIGSYGEVKLSLNYCHSSGL